MTRTALLLMLAVGASACAPGQEPEGSQLLVPANVEFPWNEAYNQVDDGLAAVLPLDVMVYEAISGEPVAGVEVELLSDAAAFVVADLLLSDDGTCEACVWDAYRDEYIDLEPGAGEVPLVVETDATGLARVYAVIDALPHSDGGFEPVRVSVSLGHQEQSLLLEPR